MQRAFIAITISLAAATGARRAADQPPQAARTRPDGTPRGCATPVSERKAEAGCYTTAVAPMGPLAAGKWFWHIDEFASREAAQAARGERGTVVESLGRQWLFTIADERWRPNGGDRAAHIGPLDVSGGQAYTAQYMEAVFPPDLYTGLIGHRHPGSEAWLVLTGTQCLETPNGLIMASAGNAALVPEGWPMAISAVGPKTRRALVLILFRSDERYSMPVHHQTHAGSAFADWKPKGLCPQ
jgi:quercetin dioxygenase-like cupin family protein